MKGKSKGQTEKKLAEMGIELPTPTAPIAAYVPFVRSGDLIFISGQMPIGPEGCVTGTLSAADHSSDATPAADSKLGIAIGASKLAAVNLLAQLKVALGDLDRVTRVVKLTGFVSSDGTFTQHPQVINGASSLMIDTFGEAGRHARAAVGCSSLPLGAICEVDGIFEVE